MHAGTGFQPALTYLHAGADLRFFKRKLNAEGMRHAWGVRGHAPLKNFEIQGPPYM